MRLPRALLAFALMLLISVSQLATVHAIDIKLDYTYDSQGFFGGGNPAGAAAGAQAKAALEAAADFFSDLLTDTFSPIVTPDPFVNGSATYTWDWEIKFNHPGTGSEITLGDNEPNPVIAADEFRIYAGGRSLAGTTLGQGGPGGYSTSAGGSYFPQDKSTIDAITDDFFGAAETRGETSGFSSWGGVVTFDNDGSADWHFDHTMPVTGSDDDFYSVAFHELGHALGLGTSDEWNTLLSGGNFYGTNAVAEYGGPVPADSGHFAAGVMSVVLGTTTIQEAAMDPNITNGTRKLWTNVDAAAMQDIGWDLTIPSPVYDPADFDNDGDVDGYDLATWQSAFGGGNGGDTDNDGDTDSADFLAWQQQYTGTLFLAAHTVPEPTTGMLLALMGIGVLTRRCKSVGSTPGD